MSEATRTLTAPELRRLIEAGNENLSWQDLLNWRSDLFLLESYDFENSVEYARMLSRGRNSDSIVQALKILDEVIADSKGSYLKAFLVKSRVLAQESLFADAAQVLESARKLHPTNYWPLLRHAELLASLNDHNGAFDRLNAARQLPRDIWSNANIFDCFLGVCESKYGSSVDSSRYRPGKVAPPVIDALCVYLIKDEGDIISHNLRHHYNSGFRNFIIIDNDSRDDTQGKVFKFREERQDALVFYLLDPIKGHYQATKTNAAVKLGIDLLSAIGVPIRWVFPIDADEFICAGGNHTVLSMLQQADKSEIDVLAFNLHNAASSRYKDDLLSEDDPFEYFDLRRSPPVENSFKVALRFSSDVRFEEGNHRPTSGLDLLERTAVASQFGFFTFHFPLRSVKHVRSKVIKGGLAFDAAPDLVNVGGHWKRWYKQYQIHGEKFFADLLESYISGFGGKLE